MKRLITTALATVLGLSLITACADTSSSDTSTNGTDTAKPEVLKVGVVGAKNETWADVAKRFEAGEGIRLEVVEFTDYHQPNEALANGDLDLNAFQHHMFLENFNKERGTDLVAIADTSLAPLGLYSKQVTQIDQVEDGAKIAIPNDVTNLARSLFLLQTAGLITVDGEPGEPITTKDITANPRNFEIIEIDASQTARSMDDVTLAAINNGMASDSGLVPSQDAVLLEPVDENSAPYINIIAARNADKDNPWYQVLIKDYFQTDETAAVIQEVSKGSTFIAWGGFESIETPTE